MNSSFRIYRNSQKLEAYLGEGVSSYATDWHFHRTWQLVLITAGAREFNFFDQPSFNLSSDSLLVIPPGLVHRGQADGPASFKMLYLPARFAPLSLPDHRTSLVLKDRALIALFGELHQHLQGNQPEPSFRKLVSDFCRTAANLIRNQIRPSDFSKTAPAMPVLQATRLLQNHLDRSPAIAELAIAAGLNKHYFIQLFHKVNGLPPLAYNLCARVLAGRELLADGADISRVATRLGFADQSHFGRHFRRIFGLTPAAYRQNVRERRERIR